MRNHSLYSAAGKVAPAPSISDPPGGTSGAVTLIADTLRGTASARQPLMAAAASRTKAPQFGTRRLTELATDVRLRMAMLGGFEELPRRPEFDQIPGSSALARVDVQESGVIGDALRLLQVVRDDGDRVALAQFEHQLFDSPGGDRIERRGRLVHQNHFRFGRDRPRDAQALLLTARQRQPALLQLVLDFVPKRSALQRLLDASSDVALEAVQAESEGDVVVDAGRERIWLLKHHADEAAHGHRVDRRVIDVVAAVFHVAFEAEAADQIVHPVEA